VSRSLRRTVTVSQGVALYVGAVVGAGVLLLPGISANQAGPASIVAWLFDSLLGIPLALTFAALASRFPTAGGVATFATKGFGPVIGTAVGWWLFRIGMLCLVFATIGFAPSFPVLLACAGAADGTPGIEKVNFIGHRHLIERMVDEDTYCVDVLKQTTVIEKALERVDLPS